MTMFHRRIFLAVSSSVLLSCLIESSHAWVEQKTEIVSLNYNGFELRTRERVLKKSKKDSKDGSASYNYKKDSKSDKSGNGYYNYYYPGDAGFLDEDIAGDFEDMFGYIVTADHFSYPSYTERSSKKSSKSSKSDYHYVPGMSYPYFEEGKGGKAGKRSKLPYYDPHAEVRVGKGSKGGPPKLTRPPSPLLPESSPDEVDGPESAVPTDLHGMEPGTPTPTSSAPGQPTDQSEEPTMTPQFGGNETLSPTTSDPVEPIDATKNLIEQVSIPLYAITYDIEDGAMSSREEDIPELTALTRSVFKDHMDQYFVEFPLSILVGFETEFVRMGVNAQNELFVVFRSYALFDKGSFVIPEADQLELTLFEALQVGEKLWMEYMAALQQLNPKNVFSERVSLAYSGEAPPASTPRLSVSDSTPAIAAIAAAAAGVTIVAIGLIVMRRKRKVTSSLLGDDVTPPSKQSMFRSNGDSGSDTASDTYNASLEGLQTVPLTSTIDSTAEIDEENGSIANDTSVYTTGDNRTNADDWSKYKKYSFDDDDSEDDDSEYSDDAIASTAEDSMESESLINEKSPRNSTKLHPWREAPAINTGSSGARQTPSSACDNELTERQRGSNEKSITKDESSSEHKKHMAEKRSQEEAKHLEKRKLAVERAALENWLKKEKMSRLADEKRLSEEKHKAELAKIEAEEAARVAQELRAQEEQRFAREKEEFESKLKQKEKARQYEEKKLLVAKANFEALIRSEKEARKALELRLLQEKETADESVKMAERRAKDAERKIKRERRKLEEAKEAMEKKKHEVNGNQELPPLLEEEDVYLRQLRAAEAAREEDFRASKEVSRASDIRKLQELRFEEKERDLETLRMKEAEAAKYAEEKVKADFTPEESLIWEKAKELSKELSKKQDFTDTGVENADDESADRLAMALRLAQSWENPESSTVTMDEDRKSDDYDDVHSSLKDQQAEEGEHRQDPQDESQSHTDEEDHVDQVLANKARSKEGQEISSNLTDELNDAIIGSEHQTQEGTTSEDTAEIAPMQPEEDASIVSDLVLPEALRRRFEESGTVIPKIGPAQFIAPWNEQNEAEEKSRESRNRKSGTIARAKKSNGGSNESVTSQSIASNGNASIKSSATPASVDDDDTCSEFSLRTSATLSSGFSKILPR